MTRPAAAPDAVRRHLSRSLLRLGGVSIVVLLSWVGDLWSAHTDDRTFDRGFHVTARVAADYRGGEDVPLVYDNPLTGETDAEAFRWSADAPRAGARVDVDVDRDNPDRVALRGDRYPAVPASMVLVIAGAPLLAYGIRRWSLRRARRLLSAPEPAFLMFGAVSVGGLRRQAVYLNLFPVDAAPGAGPVCSVRLVSPEGLPLGGPAFRVEVKGTPRPFARVVARVGDQVLWPRARALGRARSVTLPAAVAPPPVFRPADPADVPGAPAPRWSPTVRRPLVGLLGATLFGLAVTAGSVEGWRSARDLEREGTPVVATIGDRTDEALDVTYHRPDSERSRPGEAHVSYPKDWKKGRQYPAVASATDPAYVRLLADSYDIGTPVAFGWLPAAALAVWLLRSYLLHRAVSRSMAGPWYEAGAWSLGDAPFGRGLQVALAHPDADEPSCVVRVPTTVGLTFPTRRSVLVSAIPSPDSVFALHRLGRTLPAIGLAGIPRAIDPDD